MSRTSLRPIRLPLLSRISTLVIVVSWPCWPTKSMSLPAVSLNWIPSAGFVEPVGSRNEVFSPVAVRKMSFPATVRSSTGSKTTKPLRKSLPRTMRRLNGLLAVPMLPCSAVRNIATCGPPSSSATNIAPASPTTNWTLVLAMRISPPLLWMS